MSEMYVRPEMSVMCDTAKIPTCMITGISVISLMAAEKVELCGYYYCKAVDDRTEFV
jgi:hypothetical protein